MLTWQTPRPMSTIFSTRLDGTPFMSVRSPVLLLYTQYGFLKRYMMKRIVRDKPGDLSLDTSRDHVYTEWDSVKRFTRISWSGSFSRTRAPPRARTCSGGHGQQTVGEG